MSHEIVSLEAVSADIEATLASVDQTAIDTAYGERWGAAEDITKLKSFQAAAPQMPDTEAREIYEAIRDAESSLAAPNHSLYEYGEGTARYDDELTVIGVGPILAEAQHGTDPVRKLTGIREAADHGTSGLAAVLARRNGFQSIIPLGRQTSNANVDPAHPIRRELGRQFDSTTHVGFLSIHGCFAGKITNPLDTSEVHAVIGLGKDPSDVSWESATLLQERAKDAYGLRLLIGNQQPHVNYAKDRSKGAEYFNDRFAYLDRDDEGKLKPTRLAALTKASTTTFMSRTAEAQLADGQSFPSMQLEISRSLRLLPEDAYQQGRKNEYMAVYLGYCLGVLAAEVCTEMRTNSEA